MSIRPLTYNTTYYVSGYVACGCGYRLMTAVQPWITGSRDSRSSIVTKSHILVHCLSGTRQWQFIIVNFQYVKQREWIEVTKTTDERKTSDQMDKTLLKKWKDEDRKHTYSYKSHANQQSKDIFLYSERGTTGITKNIMIAATNLSNPQILNFSDFYSKLFMVLLLLVNALLLSIFCPCCSHDYGISTTLYRSITSVSCTELPVQTDNIQFSTMYF